jgi:hypothetical protein
MVMKATKEVQDPKSVRFHQTRLGTKGRVIARAAEIWINDDHYPERSS